MREKIEWIEPIEVARERDAKHRREMNWQHRVYAGCGLLGAFLAFAPFSGPDSEWFAALGRRLFVFASIGAVFFKWAARPRPEPCPGSYVLDAKAKHLWKNARAFEIANHPKLTGIRRLTICFKGLRPDEQLDFLEGQLDEAELRAFIEARIAEPIAQRLMRRVRM